MLASRNTLAAAGPTPFNLVTGNVPTYNKFNILTIEEVE